MESKVTPQNSINITMADEDLTEQPTAASGSKKPSSTFRDFCQNHYIKKGEKPSTNTRIGDKSNHIIGGSYHIPEDEYDAFLKLYYRDIVSKKKTEYLTESQLKTGNGPILVDIDLRFAYDIPARVYDDSAIGDLITGYLEELSEIYQFDSDVNFQIYVFEKDSINRVEEKQITKDGIHIIIGLQADHIVQVYLREKMVKQLSEMWGDYPIINTWDDVLDKGISEGYTNWQLYGSQKPNFEAYKLTKIYNIKPDPADGQLIDNPMSKEDVAKFVNADNFPKLSARYSDHPQFFFKSAFSKIYEDRRAKMGGGSGAGAGAGAGMRRPSPQPTNDFASDFVMGIAEISRIRNAAELEHFVSRFKESLSTMDFELREAHDYTMTLPGSYYEDGSYAKWIRVGWALHNISNRLLITWIALSAKSRTFQYNTIFDLCDQWSKFVRKSDGLKIRSIIYWSKQDAYAEYKKVRENSIEYWIERTIDPALNSDAKTKMGCGEADIAVVLYQLYKDEYICVSVKSNIWYRFYKHRWWMNDSGTTLRKAISHELRDLYQAHCARIMHQASGLDPEDERSKAMKVKTQKILDICSRLSRTNDKKNIMTEAKDLFWDTSFLQKMDNNPYLLCFNNGVYDFKDKVFREGFPEDYLTKCTNIDYVPLNPVKHTPIMNEIVAFMKQLFPTAELCKYMWDHLASTLVGTASVNQTFNMYIGQGQNGKSVLTDLMSQVLGDYKVGVPITLLTGARGKIGGLAPEVVLMKGARYAVIQEPDHAERINVGVMKELVSGVEPIQARAPYMIEPVTFIPQFKLILCANEFMEIKTRDHGTWRRIRVVDFESLFTEKPVSDDLEKPHQFMLDKNLKNKFPVWREVFAAMLVKRVLETNGEVEDCARVLASSNSYREQQDYISEFIRAKVVKDTGSSIRKSQLTEEFKIWYSSNYGGKNPSPKDMHVHMDKLFGKNKSGVWSNVMLKYNDMYEDETNKLPDETAIEEDINNIHLQEI